MEYSEEEFITKIHEQVRPKSYFEKYQGFKKSVIWLSYLFNLTSILTSSYAVYWLINWLTGVSMVGYLVASIFLFFLEKIKRKSSNEFFQMLLFNKSFAGGWFGLSLFCLSISLLSSSFGVYEVTQSLAPDAELLKADSMATYYHTQIAMLEAKGAELRANKDSKGITFYKLSDGITANEKTIADYRKRAKELEIQLAGKNEQLTKQYSKEVELTAWTLVWLTLLMEILFECCIAYSWYFYHRSYIELTKTNNFSLEDELNSKFDQIPHSDDSVQNRIEALENKIKALYGLNNQYDGIMQPNGEKDAIGLKNDIRQPIGFFSDTQKIEIDNFLKSSANNSGQAWTDVDKLNLIDDKFTIEHTYVRGGKEKTVRYTMRMVNSRIGQYKRELEEAIKNKLDISIIENRRRWLNYWKDKKSELLDKQRDTV